MSLEQNAIPTLRQKLVGGRARALDLAERLGVLLLFLLFLQRMLPRLTDLVLIEAAHPDLIWQAADVNAQALLLVIGEGLVAALILLRRGSATQSQHPLDWVLSFGAVSAPLLLTRPAAAGTLVPAALATALMLAGLAMQIAGKLALWRSFGLVPANRGVRTRGPYRFLRHPIYAGYTLIHIGFLLGFPSLPNALLYATLFAVEVVRLLREEAVLNRDPDYRAYAARVRYRLLPGVF
jgi:protein-S-isoprenylcysteine O-methyltransferase Ste14